MSCYIDHLKTFTKYATELIASRHLRLLLVSDTVIKNLFSENIQVHVLTYRDSDICRPIANIYGESETQTCLCLHLFTNSFLYWNRVYFHSVFFRLWILNLVTNYIQQFFLDFSCICKRQINFRKTNRDLPLANLLKVNWNLL